MNSFYPEEFFDLTSFAHRVLFVLNEPVWNVLKNIENYLLNFPLGKKLGRIEEGAFLINPELISIGAGSVVEAGAYIKGPCVIGENCQARHGAYIRGSVITGDKCIIGHATEVKNSLFLNGAQAAHLAYVGDSILGNRVNLGAGTICANLRFDHAPIPVIWEDQRIDTGLRKFGAILGDEAQTGCNCVTNPGTVMSKKMRLTPCCTAKGFVSFSNK